MLHDHDDPEKCSHCAKALKELREMLMALNWGEQVLPPSMRARA